jgi:plastocyanin
MLDEGILKMRKVIPLLAVLGIAAIGIAACGGDDDSDTASSEPAATEEAPAEEAPAEAPAGESGSEAGSGEAGGSQAQLSADPGGQLAYEQSSLSAAAPNVEVAFSNPSALPHDVRIEDADGNDLGGTEVLTEGEQTVSLDLESGAYTFFCSVPGHRQAGMEGTLTVE